MAANRLAQDLREELYIRTRIDMTHPYAIRGLMSRRCNYRCRYCGDWRERDHSEDMTLDQWRQTLLSLKRFIGTYVIQFSGGEPFLYKGFCDLLEFCDANGIMFGMVTNGSFFDQATSRRVVAAGPTNIDISVDGLDPASHDVVRGVPGSFDRISAGMDTLRKEMNSQRRSIPLRIKTTVHARNFRELPDLVRWTEKIGATTIGFQPVRHWTPEVMDELWIQSDAELDELQLIAEELVGLKENGAPIETSRDRIISMPAHFRHEQTDPGLTPCRAGLGDYHIQADGDVYLCWLYEPIGNAKQQEAREIWHGPEAVTQRRQMINCERLGDRDCAGSCLSRRPLWQEFKRGLLILKRSF